MVEVRAVFCYCLDLGDRCLETICESCLQNPQNEMVVIVEPILINYSNPLPLNSD